MDGTVDRAVEEGSTRGSVRSGGEEETRDTNGAPKQQPDEEVQR